ncbi:MAG: alpha/beta fold hydrolase [Gammaproteobacteria bacterium]|nr:alpha/beta fold hydrolase [Gammaproteobacteria bacterium]
MLRLALIAIHLIEVLLYSWIYSVAGGGWWVWLSTVLFMGLTARAILIALTLIIARVPLTPPGTTLAAFAAEYYSAVRLYSWDALLGAPRLVAPTQTAPNPFPPILFIHGFMCNAGFWRGFLRFFADHWNNYVATIDLVPLHTSIDDYAGHIDQRIDELLAVSGASSCLIVAHSMGGLVTRSYLHKLHAHHKVAGVVTLGTPHSGTVLADYSLAINSRQMRRLSAWLTALDESESAATQPPFAALIGTHDNIVAPQECASYRLADNTYMFGITHLAMALNRQVMEWTLHSLLRIASQATRTSSGTG